MSLTVLVKSKAPVEIIRWFLEPKGHVLYANGPVIQMSLDEFRATGHEWVRRHFEEYARVRVPANKVVKAFQPGEGAKFMKGRQAIEIDTDPKKDLIFSPMIIGRYDLADLERVKPLAERTIPMDSSSAVFWKNFDEALAAAPLDG
jgi:hypothetical protein